MSRPRRRQLGLPGVLVAVGSAAVTAFVAGATTGAVTGSAIARTDASATGVPPGVLDEAAAQIVAKANRPVDRTTLDRAAVTGMLGVLDDHWAVYYGRSDYAQFQDLLDGSYTGVGLWLRSDEVGRLVVAGVAPSSAAATAQVQVGDEVTEVAGRATRGRGVDAVTTPLRGDAGSSVEVGVARGDARRVVTLRREVVAAADAVVDWPAPDVMRIRVAAFSHGVGAQVRAALAGRRDQPVRGVVLDLRANPGGLLSEAVDTASAFLDGGPVVAYERPGAGPQTLSAAAGGDVASPLVVVVDGATASAAEVVASALQDRGRAVLVGSTTYGKGSVQEPVALSDGSAVELTVGRYLTPRGRSLDAVGLEPDVVVPAGTAGVAGVAGEDTAVRRSLDVLAGLS